MALIECPQCGVKVSDRSGRCPECHYPFGQLYGRPPPIRPASTRASAGASTGSKFLVGWIGVVIGVVALATLTNRFVGPTFGPTPTPTRTGEAKVNLGMRSASLGSQGQAAELMTLMTARPGLARYEIAYETDIDAVVLAADLNTERLYRVHSYRDPRQSSTCETWSGYVLDRLRAGLRGGSLNETPVGSRQVDFRLC